MEQTPFCTNESHTLPPNYLTRWQLWLYSPLLTFFAFNLRLNHSSMYALFVSVALSPRDASNCACILPSLVTFKWQSLEVFLAWLSQIVLSFFHVWGKSCISTLVMVESLLDGSCHSKRGVADRLILKVVSLGSKLKHGTGSWPRIGDRSNFVCSTVCFFP